MLPASLRTGPPDTQLAACIHASGGALLFAANIGKAD